MSPMKATSPPSTNAIIDVGFVTVSKGALMNIIGNAKTITKPAINRITPATKAILAGSTASLLMIVWFYGLW